MRGEMMRLQRGNEEAQYQLSKKEADLRESKLKLDKADSERHKEVMALRKEMQQLRGKEHDMMDKAKELAEYEAAMQLKLTFYERKIKEHLDTIDRKETLVDKYKITIGELEEKLGEAQQAVRRSTDEADQLRGYKHDCQRKETLLKEYKAKIERLKSGQEDTSRESTKLKGEVSKLKSDKIRLETQLDIKERELVGLRSKNERMAAERQEEMQREGHRVQQHKGAQDSKLKAVRREK